MQDPALKSSFSFRQLKKLLLDFKYFSLTTLTLNTLCGQGV